MFQKFTLGDLPGGPVVKTLRSQCRGPGSNPWLIPGRGTKIPYVAQWPKKKKVHCDCYVEERWAGDERQKWKQRDSCAQSLQSCPTLCDPMDHGLPGSSAHGILQARMQEWVAMTRRSSFWCKVKSLSHVCSLRPHAL